MQRIILILGLLILNSLASCKENDDLELIRDDYSISYPSHLELNESEKNGAEFVLVTNKTTDDDDFIENINLIIHTTENLNLDKFIEISESDIKNVGEIIESKREMTNDTEYHRLLFTVTQNNVQATFIQHYFVKDKKAFVLTFSGKSEEFEDYYKEMNKVMLSFQLN